ncbi:MAG: hypothetical protein AAF889_12020, partial [Cyanobacteria bacterium P01_D01_bin.73]
LWDDQPMKKTRFPTIKTGLATIVGIGTALATGTPALAGNAVFDQSLSTVEKHFGRYHTRLTHADGNRDYTFSTNKLRREIPELPQGTKFVIYFVDGNARDVRLDYPDRPLELDLYNQAIAQKLFKFVLGWDAPKWEELNYSILGAMMEETNEYCLGDGVATSWKTANLNGYTWFVENPKLYYKAKCE